MDCTQQNKVVSLLGFLGTRVRIRNGLIGLLDNSIRPSFEVHAVLFVGCIGSKYICMYQLHSIRVADSVQNWVPRQRFQSEIAKKRGAILNAPSSIKKRVYHGTF